MNAWIPWVLRPTESLCRGTRSWVLVLGLFSACVLPAQGATPAVAQAKSAGTSANTPSAPRVGDWKPVHAVEGISEYRLPNGLQLLLVPDDSKPTTTVNLTVKVGSRHENYGETGMAHLLEHLLFKGSTRHPNAWAPTAPPGWIAPTTLPALPPTRTTWPG